MGKEENTRKSKAPRSKLWSKHTLTHAWVQTHIDIHTQTHTSAARNSQGVLFCRAKWTFRRVPSCGILAKLLR